MDLLIVRHAIAFERDQHRWHDDGERPLSAAGIRRARRAAAGLKELLAAPDRVLASPLLRARQTARILTAMAGWPEAVDCPELSPDAPALPLLALLGKERGKCVAVVGHQPSLGLLLAACLIGDAGPLAIGIKKNGVACVSFKGAPRPGQATLKWLATPRMLRAIRGKE